MRKYKEKHKKIGKLAKRKKPQNKTQKKKHNIDEMA